MHCRLETSAALFRQAAASDLKVAVAQLNVNGATAEERLLWDQSNLAARAATPLRLLRACGWE